MLDSISFADILRTVLNALYSAYTTLRDITFGAVSLSSIFFAALITIGGILVVNLLMILIKRLIARTSWDDNLKHVIELVARVVLYVIVALIAADALGVPVTSLVAVLSVAGLAVSLAIQDTLSNVFSGMLLLTAKTFASGDYVQVSGLEGTVTKVDLMNTYLRTADHKTVRIPNKDVQAAPIVNYSREPLRRVEIRVSVSYNDDTERVKAALLRAAERVDTVLKDPAPFAGLAAYGNSSIEYVVHAWTNGATYWPSFYGLNEAVRETFREDGIAMTYDHINVHMVEGD